MRAIAIIGAGELGGALAHVLARRHAAAAVHLIDDSGRVAEGKALDLMQAAAIMATFVYQTAMRDEMMPRKVLPKPQPATPAVAPEKKPEDGKPPVTTEGN